MLWFINGKCAVIQCQLQSHELLSTNKRSKGVYKNSMYYVCVCVWAVVGHCPSNDKVYFKRRRRQLIRSLLLEKRLGERFNEGIQTPKRDNWMHKLNDSRFKMSSCNAPIDYLKWIPTIWSNKRLNHWKKTSVNLRLPMYSYNEQHVYYSRIWKKSQCALKSWSKSKSLRWNQLALNTSFLYKWSIFYIAR